MTEEITVFRTPMRARSLDPDDRYEGARFGVQNSLAGIGEPLASPPANLSEAIDSLASRYGEKAGRMLARFADLPLASFLWTQTAEEEFRLGRLTGPWRYDTSEAAKRTGIHHVRPAKWLEERFDISSTPPAVVNTFGRGGRNLQRVNDPEAETQTAKLWPEAAG